MFFTEFLSLRNITNNGKVLHPSCHYSGLTVFMVPIYNKLILHMLAKHFHPTSCVLFLNFLSMIGAPGMIKLFSFHQLPLIASFFRKCLFHPSSTFLNYTQFPKPIPIPKILVRINILFLFTKHFYKKKFINCFPYPRKLYGN